jgi:phosphoribosylformimino-5-aminoimidazole carboxamide ribonucleotide (ProFAR) isomerase
MLIIPAIDLKDGHCVRLKQGVMEGATVFSEDPGAMARHWVDQGGKRLHLVDLNGALQVSQSMRVQLNPSWQRSKAKSLSSWAAGFVI